VTEGVQKSFYRYICLHAHSQIICTDDTNVYLFNPKCFFPKQTVSERKTIFLCEEECRTYKLKFKYGPVNRRPQFIRTGIIKYLTVFLVEFLHGFESPKLGERTVPSSVSPQGKEQKAKFSGNIIMTQIHEDRHNSLIVAEKCEKHPRHTGFLLPPRT
jgi:hypothetical protein